MKKIYFYVAVLAAIFADVIMVKWIMSLTMGK